MSSKRNQTIAIARFLMYKYGLNQQLEGMTDEEYMAHPCVVNAVFVKLMELEDEQEETNHMNEIEQDELDEDMTAEL